MALRYGIRVESRFCAAHQVRLPGGELEPLHGHDWTVRVECCRERLGDDDMVRDFHQAESVVRSLLAPLHHANLNVLPAFANRNPTAEAVAEWVLMQLRKGPLPDAVRVEVTESPGCTATCEWTNPG